MKNRLFAAIFAWMFGGIGLNEYYLGNTKTGIIETVLSVLFSWTVIVPCVIAVINIVKGIMYLWAESEDAFNEKYATR